MLAQGDSQRLVLRLAVVAARQARLVGDDDQCIARLLQAAHAFDGAGHELEVLPAVDIDLVLVDDAVKVEEGGLAQHGRQRLTDALDQGRGGKTIHKRNDHRPTAPDAHHARFLQRFHVGVAALNVDVGAHGFDQLHRAQAGQHVGVVFGSVKRPVRPFTQHARRSVAADRHQQGAAQLGRALQIAHVATVQHVEHAIGHDQRAR